MSDYEYVDPNWCPDCGLPRGVCTCEEVFEANEFLEDFYADWFEPDEDDWEAYDYTEGDIGQDGEI